MGGLKQRDLEIAVKTVGGRSSKAVGRARAAAADLMAKKPGVFSGDRIHGVQRGPVGEKLLRGALKGMLSPAGLAEGVAGSVAKLSDKAGRQKLQQAMHAKDKVKMPPPPKPGKKRA